MWHHDREQFPYDRGKIVVDKWGTALMEAIFSGPFTGLRVKREVTV
jgi:hypothetical protein